MDGIWQLSYIDTISILFSVFHFSFFFSPFPASPCGGYNSRATRQNTVVTGEIHALAGRFNSDFAHLQFENPFSKLSVVIRLSDSRRQRFKNSGDNMEIITKK